ncbi:MAG: EAL domain-containing protein [Deltaproteobacteria bacterium]|nr:EAL domain-containing protein [Deltaproteobacteria bacterium]
MSHQVNRTISTKYATRFAGLLAVLIVGALCLAGFTGLALTRDLHRELKSTISRAQIVNQKEILLESTNYLSNRLFNPLFNLDISSINDEINHIKILIPSSSVLILDKNGQILTDGRDGTPRYGEKINVPPMVKPNAPILLQTEAGKDLFFAIGFDDEIAGYTRIHLDNNLFNASIATLEKELENLWANFRQSLAILAAMGVSLTMMLGFYLSWRLSRSISKPLAEMGHAADQFATGNLEHQLNIQTNDEVGALAKALNKMAGNLKKTSQLLSKAQEMAGLGSWEWNRVTNQLVLSSGAFQILGITQKNSELRVEYLLAMLRPDARSRVSRALNLSRKKNISVEFTFLRNNQERLIHLQGEPVAASNGHPGGCIGTIQDVTEQRRSEKKMTYLANYDTLTDLPNRNLFQERLTHAINQANRNSSSVALLFIDLDRFKAINDSLGHHIGDKLLNSVAIRLLKVLRECDSVARLGGDEFTVILEDLDSPQYAAMVAQKVLDKLSRSFILEGRELFITASIGITIYPRDAEDTGTLLKNADTAMYLAKDEGKGTYRFYTPELNVLAHKRMDLENSLRKAIEKREFEIHYQPQLNLETGELTAMEALLRWRHKGRWIPPDEFIPVLDETGMLSELTGWMLKETCTRTSQWRNAGFRNVKIAVNLTAKQVQQEDLINLLQRTLKLTGLPPENLELEITENALVNQKAADSNLSHIKRLGVKLAVDDFGTGYSSLSYLKLFNVDTLKIDRAFIRDILTDKNDALITSAVVALSKHLGITTVAEGVETQEQADLLHKLGCNIVQGFLFSRPLPAEQFLDWAQCHHVSTSKIDMPVFQSA